jgi:cytochrome c1
LPLVAFLIWLMRQDKRKGVTGIIIVIILVVGAIVWTYLRRDADKKLPPREQSGSMQPHI